MSRVSGRQRGIKEGWPSDRPEVIAILKECALHARGLLAGIGYEADGTAFFEKKSKVVSEKGGVMDIAYEGEEGITRLVKGYTVCPTAKLTAEVQAAKIAMKLFDESADDYLSGKIKRYVSVMVVTGGSGEAVRTYHIKSRRLDRQYGKVGGDDFLDIMVIDVESQEMKEIEGGPDLIAPLFDCGLDAEATLGVLEKGLKTGLDRTAAVCVAEMKGFLRGYVEGRKGAEPSFDFARAVEEAGRKDAIKLAELAVAVYAVKKVPLEDSMDAMKLEGNLRAMVEREAERLMKTVRFSERDSRCRPSDNLCACRPCSFCRMPACAYRGAVPFGGGHVAAFDGEFGEFPPVRTRNRISYLQPFLSTFLRRPTR